MWPWHEDSAHLLGYEALICAMWCVQYSGKLVLTVLMPAFLMSRSIRHNSKKCSTQELSCSNQCLGCLLLRRMHVKRQMLGCAKC